MIQSKLHSIVLTLLQWVGVLSVGTGSFALIRHELVLL